MTTIVEVLVLKDAFPSSVAVTFDVLATANCLSERGGRPPAFAVRATGSGAHQARAFVGGADAVGAAAVLIVPGLGLNTEEELSARLAIKDAELARRALVTAIEGGSTVAASCSGVFLLASAGLLAGRRATTTWWLAPLFRRLHPDVRLDADAVVVTDGPVTTAGAAMAQLDLMLTLVARHAGAGLADACARYLLLDQRRSQSRYMALGFLAAADDRFPRAARGARDRLETPVSVDDMAAVAALSPRTFARRVERATGLSPIGLLQRLRVEHAVALIETTRLPLDEVARRVGYADPSMLRRLIKRHAGTGARALRPV